MFETLDDLLAASPEAAKPKAKPKAKATTTAAPKQRYGVLKTLTTVLPSESPFIPLSANKAPMLPWSKERIKREDAEKFENVGYNLPEDIVIIDCDSVEATAEVQAFIKSMGLDVPHYATNKGFHYIFKWDDSLPWTAPGGARGTIFEDVDQRSHKNFVMIRKNNEWRITPEKLEATFSSAPILPIVFAVPKGMKIKLEDYQKGERDETMFKNWLPKLRGKGITEDQFYQFCDELIHVIRDPSSKTNQRSWAEERWNSSVNMGDVKDYFVDKDCDLDLAPFVSTRKNTSVFANIYDYGGAYDCVIKNTGLCISKEDYQFWYKDDGILKPCPRIDLIVGKYIQNDLVNVTPALISEIVRGIPNALEFRAMNTNRTMVHFKNTDYDAELDRVMDLGPGVLRANQIPHNLITEEEYNSEKYKEAVEFWDGFVKRIAMQNEEIVIEIEELIGISMTKYLKMDKAWFILGGGSNGKSIFLEFLKIILGDHNVSSVDLGKLSTNQFAASSLYGKLANINTDISDAFIADPSLFKRLVSGDSISAERKGADIFEFKPNATLVFGANSLPFLKDNGASSGVDRRIKIIPFLMKFKADLKSAKITDDLHSQEVIEVAIYRATKAVHQAFERGELFTSQVSQNYINEYLKELNQVQDFLGNVKIKSGEYSKTIYNRYEAWATDLKLRPYGIRTFEKQLVKVLKTEGFEVNLEDDRSQGTLKRVRIFFSRERDDD